MTFLMTHIIACYAAGVVGAFAALLTKRQGFFTAAIVAVVLGFGFHTAAIVQGIVADGHLPLYGAQEVCSFLGWALVLYFLIVQWRFPTKALAGLLFPTALALTLISALAAPVEQTPGLITEDPVLFSIHAGLVMLAYAAFFTMFMAAVLYIVQEREIKGKHFGAIFHRLPSLDTCDSIVVRALWSGFILLTAGIGIGMFWSYEIKGRVWTGEPIELFAVGSWLVYFALVHFRISSGFRGRRAAIVAIVSFGLIVVSLAVLRYSTGFHGLSVR